MTSRRLPSTSRDPRRTPRIAALHAVFLALESLGAWLLDALEAGRRLDEQMLVHAELPALVGLEALSRAGLHGAGEAAGVGGELAGSQRQVADG